MGVAYLAYGEPYISTPILAAEPLRWEIVLVISLPFLCNFFSAVIQ